MTPAQLFSAWQAALLANDLHYACTMHDRLVEGLEAGKSLLEPEKAELVMRWRGSRELVRQVFADPEGGVLYRDSLNKLEEAVTRLKAAETTKEAGGAVHQARQALSVLAVACVTLDRS